MMAAITVPLLQGFSSGSYTSVSHKSTAVRTFSWKVHSLDYLSIKTSELKLTQAQLDTLPKSLMKEIYDGFSRVIQASSHLIPENTNSLRFSVAEDRLSLKTECSVIEVPFGEDAQLQSALGKVIDKARIYFPEAFSCTREIESVTVANSKKANPQVDVPQFEKICGASDGLSVARNGTRIVLGVTSAVNTTTRAAASAGVLGGLLSCYIGGKLVSAGLSEYRKANSYGDTEGKVGGFLGGSIGASFAGVGVSMVGGNLPNVIYPLNTVLTNPTVSAALSVAGNFCLLAMSGFMLVNSIYTWNHLKNFREELLGIIDNKHLSEELKAKQGLAFLSQQISLTEGEMIELQKQHGSDRKALQVASKHLAETKWARFVRRVGLECATKVAKEIGTIQEGLKVNDKDLTFKKDAILKAIDILNEVDKENHKIRTKNRILFALSWLYLAVGILSFLTPLSFVVPLLFMIGAGVFIFVDLAKFHHHVSGALYNRTISPKKRWDKPLLKWEATALLANELQVGNKWYLRRLKAKVNEALDEVSQVRLTLVGKDSSQFTVDKVKNFGHLCKWLKLDSTIDFDNESIDYAALTFEQVRALRLLDRIQKAVLTVDKAAAVAAFKTALLEHKIDLDEMIGFEVGARRTYENIQVIFQEDPAHSPGSVAIESDNAICQFS